jgi:hypothetical protein
VSGCSILSPVLDAFTPLKAFPLGKSGQNWPSGFAIFACPSEQYSDVQTGSTFFKKVEKKIMLV